MRMVSILLKWHAQRVEDEERNLLQERVFNAEEHFRAMCAAGGVTNNNAEAYYQRIKNAHAELVSCIEEFFICMLTCTLISLVASHLVYATPVSPDDRIVKPPSPPRPSPSSRSAVGICSPSSGTEVVYDSQKQYEEEEPLAPSPFPETKKLWDEEFVKDLTEITRDSDEYNPRRWSSWMQ